MFGRLIALAMLPSLVAVAGCEGGNVAQARAPGPGAQLPRPTGDDTDVLAVIDGVEVTVSDLDDLIGERLALIEYEFNSERHQLIDSAARRFVRNRLLDEEAEARGTTVDALLDELFEGKVDIDEADVQMFFQQNQAQLGGRPYETISGQIRDYLEGQRQEEILQEFADELAADRDIAYVLGPFRVDIDIEGDPAIGPEDAAVTLVEFSDFECPYCSMFFETLNQIRSNYADDVRVVFKQFPLAAIHPNAAKAAEASLCAHDQGMFWETHDLYFTEQENLTIPDLEEKAVRLGLDPEAFGSCLSSGKHADRIAEDLRLGASMGVSGTPAVFINGRPLPGGAVPYEMAAEIIDEEIERNR